MSDELRVAKATAKAEKARAKALRPWYRKKRWILSGVAVGAIAIGVASGASNHSTATGATALTSASGANNGVKTLSMNTTHRPQDDVTIRSCTVDGIGFAHAGLDITNHSSKQSDYIVTVAFEDGGVQIGSGNSFVQNLDGGHRAADDAEGTVTNGTPRHMTCSIKSVDRMAS